jgi:nickel-dependent lactate racemase
MDIKIPWQAWYDETELALSFPEDWRVTVAGMADAPVVGPGAVEQALREPIGSPPLRELASRSKRAVIVVEDITRPLRTAELLPAVLAELAAGGLASDDVRFVIGLGAHTPMNRADLIKKLGHDIAQRCAVYQNTPYENCEYLGDTRLGTPVYINRFFLEADLRISLGTLTPHAYAGYGGGAKTVAVGVAGIETLHANHGRAYSSQAVSTAQVDDNVCRADMEEIARMAGLAFAINGVLNSRCELAGLFAGDLVRAHRAAAVFAGQVSATVLPPPADVAVFNAYPKDTNLLQSINALNVIGYDLRRAIPADGTAVLAAACTDGLGINYLESTGMRLYLRFTREMMGLGQHSAIIFSPDLTLSEVRQMYPDDTLLFNRWEQVIEELTRRHGDCASTTIFPCGALQVPAE